MTDEELFWSKVNKNGPIEREELGQCWLWIPAPNDAGYGLFHNRHAHREAWKFTFGNITDELFVLHKCDVRRCVRPSHLFLGTQADNIRDMFSKGRQGWYDKSGSNHPMFKIGEDKANEIKRMMELGINAKTIAAKYNISRGHVYVIYHTTIEREGK